MNEYLKSDVLWSKINLDNYHCLYESVISFLTPFNSEFLQLFAHNIEKNICFSIWYKNPKIQKKKLNVKKLNIES